MVLLIIIINEFMALKPGFVHRGHSLKARLIMTAAVGDSIDCRSLVECTFFVHQQRAYQRDMFETFLVVL